MIDTIVSFFSNAENNKLLVLMASGGILFTVFHNIQSIFGMLWTGVLNIISFTVTNVQTVEYDMPDINNKFVKTVSGSKILWERNIELRPTSSDWKEKHMTDAAFGTSYRWMYGRLVKLDRSYSMETTKLTVTTVLRVFFSRKSKFVKRLNADIENCSLTKDNDTVMVNMGNGAQQEKKKRSVSTIYSNDGLCERILSDVRSFMENRETYEENGSPWKHVMLFSGGAGTGKSSCIHAIASEIGYGIRYLDLTDSDFKDLLRISSNAHNEILVVEDLDAITSNANESRGGDGGERQPVEKRRSDDCDSDGFDIKPPTISLSALLNLTDGVCVPPGCIMIFTTNHPEKLDEAFLRDGRINGWYHFENFTRETANKVMRDKLGFDLGERTKDGIQPSSLQESVLKMKLGRMTKEEFVAKFSITEGE